MAADRQDYPAILKKLQPALAADVLNERVRQVGRLNTAIADWLQERRRLEEQYATGLRRLARITIDENDLGIFSVPWSQITKSIEALADSHQSLASGIDVDVERPLREFASNNREMQAMSTIQGNLLSMAKDIERAQQKADRLQGKGEKFDTGKVANVSSELDNARSQWDSQAPYVFENLQALDETRLVHLRDHLTQFQTLEVDQVERNRVAAEQTLNALLNVETQDEIKTFAIKAVSGKAAQNRARRASLIPTVPSTPSRSGTDNDAAQPSSSAPESSKKSGLMGLRRLGTVMKRKDKESSQSSEVSEKPDRKSKSFNSFGKLGRSKESYQGSLEPPREEGSEDRARSPARALRSRNEESESLAESTTEPTPRQPEDPSFTNGPGVNQFIGSPPVSNGSRYADIPPLEPQKPLQPSAAAEDQAVESSAVSAGFTSAPSDLDPISQAQAEAAAFGESNQSQFNVNIRNAPIQEEGGDAALASLANKLQAPPPTTRRAGTVRGRRDARNSAIVNTYSGQPALEENVAPGFSTEEAASSTSLQIPGQYYQAAEQATTAIPSPPAVVPKVAAVAAPTLPAIADPVSPFRPSSRMTTGVESAADTQSIRSGRSLTSTGSHGIKHPDLGEAGLNSSVIETISARFENGDLVSSSLIGEIALAYNAPNFTTPFGQETIRLDNFSSLEKVAPNPAFIESLSNKEGEYSVNLGGIARTQIAFKYQLGHDQASKQVPILVTTALKIEANQTSVIVHYSLHPSFALRAHEKVTLSNLALVLTLEGAKSTGCLSRPVGTFSREKNAIFWQLGQIVLSPNAPAEKLLARFATESPAQSGSVEVKWDINNEAAQGLGSGLAVQVLGGGSGEGADPFADDEAGSAALWKPVPAVKKLTSGVYVAKS